MPGPLVECVPNVSEGRRLEVVEELAQAVRSVPEVRLLDYSWDGAHHRSVFTFVGPPQPVVEAALALAAVAVQRIDLRQHQGLHPRIGAVDVVPFVPLRGVTMDDCVALSRTFAQALWDRYRVPVYFYAHSALRPERRWLPYIRRGGFEALQASITQPDRHPDVGEPRVHPTAGATATGAREVLIAWNFTLATDDVQVARAVARRIRQSSGGLPGIQANGWALPGGGVQVSVNVLDYRATPLDVLYEAVCAEAARFGVEVRGTEFVGLVPAEALAQVAARALRADNLVVDRVLEPRLVE
ncbi:MAG: glutamate formimidoyltransferase [Armatimonadota bacterium]|nr:glutamate formimidoyltransferase [Armatimonadota bacterium]MDW8155167.1 glutamate formimidoyltransferase [Armatimonadota bacterium]